MVFYLLFDCFIVNVRERKPDDISKVVDHVVDVFRGFFTIWVDRRLPRSGKMVSVLDGCSKLCLDHGCTCCLQEHPIANMLRFGFPLERQIAKLRMFFAVGAS
jgi:hypothetical protein